jgi:alpha-L-fucosidase 2
MLLQSHTGTVRLFPAVPASWKDIEFASLRAEGAFLISATKSHGQVYEVRIVSEKGGRLRLLNPFEFPYTLDGQWRRIKEDVIVIDMKPGQEVRLEGHDE